MVAVLVKVVVVDAVLVEVTTGGVTVCVGVVDMMTANGKTNVVEYVVVETDLALTVPSSVMHFCCV